MVQQSKQLAAAHKRQMLAFQQQQEKERLEAQRKLVKKRAAARSPYKPHHALLLIGEGNFSFARSLIDAPASSGFTPIPGRNVTATCYDSFVVAREKYADAQDNIDALRAAGARVWDNIDATQLHNDSTHFPPQPAVSLLSPPALSHYDFIIFNFPHTGSGISDTHKNIQQHQQLLTAFLRSLSCATHLLSATTRIHVTVKAGEPYSSWHVPLLPRLLPQESRSSVRFVTSVPFYPHLYPLYHHRRTIGFKGGLSAEGNEEIEGGAMSHVFMRAAESDGAVDSERPDGDEDRPLPASEQTAESEVSVDTRALSPISERTDTDEQSTTNNEPAAQQKASNRMSDVTAYDKPVVVLPISPSRSKLSDQVAKSSKRKRTAQPKSKLNLRGLLFT